MTMLHAVAGPVVSVTTSITHVYAQSDTYTVAVVVSDGVDTNSFTIEITVENLDPVFSVRRFVAVLVLFLALVTLFVAIFGAVG